jgi:hypothetical protein
MLEMPRRSVTRFFIPLIDVLTLLFCVFLMMPLAKPGDGTGPATPEETVRRLRVKLDRQKRQSDDALRHLQAELDQARQQQIQNLQKELWVRLLEIDRRGNVYYYDPDRVQISSVEQARRLVDRDRREQPGRKLYYMILSPPDGTYPTVGQQNEFETRWFKGVTLGYGNRTASGEK